MKKVLLLLMMAPLFISCEQTKQGWNTVRETVQASATGTVKVVPNDKDGQEAVAEGSFGLFGYDVYGEAKAGFKKSEEKPEVVEQVVTETK